MRIQSTASIILLFLASLMTSCGADNNKATVPLIPRKILFGNPERVSPQISPDAAYLAYLAPDGNGVLNVWLHDLKEKKEDKLLTFEKKRGIQAFRWQYDSQHIIYAQDNDGDENWHLYQTDIKTQKTRDLTPFEGTAASVVAYEAEFPQEMLIQMNQRNPTLFDIYRVNLKEGTLTLDVENKDNVVQWLADYKLQIRASAAYNAEGETIIRVRNHIDSPWREIMKWSAEDEGHLVKFSADNDSLYILSNKDSNTTQLIKYTLETGTIETVAGDPQYDLSEAVMVNPLSHKIEAIAVDRVFSEWIFLDPQVKEDFNLLEKKGMETHVISRDLKNRFWIVKYASDLCPGSFYLFDRENQSSHFLFISQPKLEPYPLSPMKAVSFKARDGMLLHGYLTLPVGEEAKNLPTVLLVHGGPWHRDTWGYNSVVQWLANRGYAVLQINFRGSTGYGKEYLNAGNREWAGKMHTDLLDSKEWMVKQNYANPDKVALFGGSYGGYATLVGLTFSPTAFCCGIDLVGPSNLVTLLETIPPYWTPLLSIFNNRVGNLKTERGFLESQSPLFKADRIRRPLLIAQGANDPRVKQSESDQIVAAMRKNNREVEYLLIPDEGHGFKRPENKMKFFSVAERFLHKYMGGRLENVSEEKEPLSKGKKE